MRKIFYDFEVYKHLWLVVIIDYDTRKGKVIVNDVDMLRKYHGAFQDDIWIGFNSRSYDQWILKGILLGYDPYYVSKKLIEEDVKGHNIIKGAWKVKLNNFDLIPNPPVGLKTLEGFLGSNIKETSVPFDLDRPLTKEEIQETIQYCIHDVRETIKVFEARTEEFESQLGLIEMFNLDMEQFNKTKAQLSAFILGAEKHDNRGDEFDFIFPDVIKLDKYKYIQEWYEDPKNRTYTDEKGKKLQLKTDIAGVQHVLGYGGIHAARSNYFAEGIILCCDVASLYPSIMINFEFLSRNVKEPAKFKEIRDTRLQLKKIKDKKEKPLKVVINGTFGASKDQYNALFDPLMANNVCIAGQLLLVDLIEKVEPYCELIQSNTDGIYMKVEDMDTVDKIKELSAEWESRTGLDLEWDIHKKIYQKDVNNYILIPEQLYDDKGKPRWKTKGAYLKKLNDLDYDLPIVNKALVNHFVFGTPMEETINNCNELREFQKLVKISSLYLYGLHGEERLKDRVLRVFADNREEAKGVFKVKLKMKDGIEQEVAEKIGNTPDKCFINNDDIKEKLVPEFLDKQYYIDLAQKRLNDFLGIKEKKSKKKVKENA